MAVHFLTEDRDPGALPKKKISGWLTQVIREEGKIPGVVNVVFCSDEYLVNVNEEFLKRNYLTDVITFDYTEGNRISGDILISIDRIRENAEERGLSFLEELKRIMVHGVLHLIGFNDDTKENKAIMTSMEDVYLGKAPE